MASTLSILKPLLSLFSTPIPFPLVTHVKFPPLYVSLAYSKFT